MHVVLWSTLDQEQKRKNEKHWKLMSCACDTIIIYHVPLNIFLVVVTVEELSKMIVELAQSLEGRSKLSIEIALAQISCAIRFWISCCCFLVHLQFLTQNIAITYGHLQGNLVSVLSVDGASCKRGMNAALLDLGCLLVVLLWWVAWLG